MAKSAGLLYYRFRHGRPEVFLIHPGGPFWASKDSGAWSIPKGEFDDHEDPFEAARREFREETGFEPAGHFVPLTPVKQKSGKWIHAWAGEGEFDENQIISNTFEMIWPPRSGILQPFPEADKAAWFSIAEAKTKLNPGQIPFLDELLTIIAKAH